MDRYGSLLKSSTLYHISFSHMLCKCILLLKQFVTSFKLNTVDNFGTFSANVTTEKEGSGMIFVPPSPFVALAFM